METVKMGGYRLTSDDLRRVADAMDNPDLRENDLAPEITFGEFLEGPDIDFLEI